jgi:hypothetical protein
LFTPLKRIGFGVRPVYRLKRPKVLSILKDKLSFLVASISLFSFILGNMIGQHGWYVFWKSVLGKDDDALIVFVGTVPPLARVPDYTRWAQYGGGSNDHTFREVPTDLLVPLPAYSPQVTRDRSSTSLAALIYSVGNLGSYETGGDHDGSHVGVDIRVPVGTPVQSIANGVVTKTSLQGNGYGHHILIKHPNVPDPNHAGQLTTLWSVYAHLDAILVTEGQVVHKGEQIATSGQTGFASGPHLHFQIDDNDAPFHPYWPFTDAEAKNAGLSFMKAINAGLHQERGALYTISPLLFTQSYSSYIASPTLPSSQNQISGISSSAQLTSSSASARSKTETFAERLARRRTDRIAARQSTRRVVSTLAQPGMFIPQQILPSSSSSSSPSFPVTIVTEEKSAQSFPLVSGSNTDVDHLSIEHSGRMTRAWQKVRISTLNAQGDLVQSPTFGGKIYLKAEFGLADIRPNELTASDFVNGVATVNVLTHGSKTTFIALKGAFQAMSAPMVYER